MPLAFRFSRILNPRLNPSTNLGLALASSFSSSSRPEQPELPGARGGGGGFPATIREGRAEIFADDSNSVFYNKAQVNNRDLSIAVLRSFISRRREEHDIQLRRGSHAELPPKHHAEELGHIRGSSEDKALSEEISYRAPKVLEALAASGLRAIRYALEVDGIGEVIAVDNNEGNNYNLATHTIYKKLVFKVDLDPYGSPAAFLDSAVQCVADGGILMCSATDMAVLAGGNAEVCFSKYGSYPLKGKHCHEMALRILLACIESHAIRHKRYIVPIISVHMDFYIRDKRNIALPNFSPLVPQECAECGHNFVMGGPIWSDPMHDKEWAASILSSIQAMSCAYSAYAKISAIMTSVSEELPKAPLFVSLHNLCATLKCTNPTIATFQSAIRNAGYQISGSHVDPLALKTDAPMSVIWDIMRCWVKIHAVKYRPGNHPGTRILSQEPKLQAKFSHVPGGLAVQKSPRFVPNPEKYWGPKTKAGRQPKRLPVDNL
uniref:tRNA (guanine(26)-N(2))-dimethyltransferase n=1 Tax=Oryza sativa TaxID=4530 RepID=Q8RU67_ORYSA|nr:Putative tRNA (Guanine-N2-)-Methyltransferase [Oryza sativa]